jgi:ubiquinone/menaquinone biosynthesis C-methylase UbiE
MLGRMTSPRYDRIAESYGSGDDDYTTPPVAALLELLGSVEGERVLDLACGHGVITRQLARLGASVVGLDLSGRLLDIARERDAVEPLGIRYLEGNAAGSALTGEAFDLVACNFGLSDIDDLPGVLDTVNRLLSSRGRFVFSILHPCFAGADEVSGSWPTKGTYYDEGWWRPQARRSTLRREVGANHRTVATYVNALVERGLYIDRLVEPSPEESWTTEHPRAAAQPVYFVARCRRIT